MSVGEEKIQRADPGARRKAKMVVLAGAVLGSAVILGFEEYRPALEAWMEGNPRTLLWILPAFGLAGAAPLFATAVWQWRFARRVHEAGRFPPPDTTVLRDTPVRTGAAASRVARVRRATAIGLAAIALAYVVVFLHLTRALAGMLD